MSKERKDLATKLSQFHAASNVSEEGKVNIEFSPSAIENNDLDDEDRNSFLNARKQIAQAFISGEILGLLKDFTDEEIKDKLNLSDEELEEFYKKLTSNTE